MFGPLSSSRDGRRLSISDQAPVLSEHAAFLGRCVPLESLPSHRSSTKKAAPPGAVNPGAPGRAAGKPGEPRSRSEEHTSELQSLMRISYAVFCLKKKKKKTK